MRATRWRHEVIGAAVAFGLMIAGLAGHATPPLASPPRQGATASIVQSTTSFAFDLYRQFSAREGNVISSPLGVSLTLGATYAGARGQTARDMAAALHFPSGPDAVHPAFAKLLSALSAETPGRELRFSNALWVHREYALLPDFARVATTSYRATTHPIDFRERESARQTINAWASHESGGRLSGLVPASVLDSQTRLLVTNVTSMKAPWSVPFKPADTREDRFAASATREVRVQMMRQTGPFKFFENDSLQVLELPCAGGDIAVLMLLPRAAEGLRALEASLSVSQVETWLKQLREQAVQISIPRVKAGTQFALRPALARLGMRRAFEPAQADFSGIGGPSGALYLAEVLHQGQIEMTEEGTVAAAGTAVVAKSLSIGLAASFEANHPFVFLIRHTSTNTVLMVGRITDPTS